MSLRRKLRLWNKGGFNFWIVGLNYMRQRDAVMGRLLTRSEEKQERQEGGSRMSEQYQNGHDDGRNYGWNEALEIVRLLRYAKEEAGDPVAVEALTEALKKLKEKE